MRLQLAKQLLDRQIVDADGRLVGRVDDIAFAVDADGHPYVDCLLTGQGALGQRIDGWIGRLLVAVADRFTDDPPVPPLRVPLAQVARLDSAVRLRCPASELPPSPVESWLRRHLVDRIPGSHRASG
ncbi:MULTISPECIES: hypothetical protein [Micromonospora]|uniref:Ig-like domain-containing protein n=1 Tax=Micromonospora solifontis TaxID=2487138 RepID=A0ABX9WJW1_9ACTN|nr:MULTISPECIES: hypothetical protein [Micromonospora]NES13554.1 hypothetical protein [Micromonospora sp. PPF5-17B]NES35678.1 hypothetical protein [Micromonospora solifontis]NES58271.1 hypothetical protein [Micromonospora sp. PPF5-6]RNM00554.1 hypothetical protein EFE23_05800 [Micromonospora solifontis]